MFIDYYNNKLTFPLDIEVRIPEYHLSHVIHTSVEVINLPFRVIFLIFPPIPFYFSINHFPSTF